MRADEACLSPVVRCDVRYSVWLACCSFCRLVMGTRSPCSPADSNHIWAGHINRGRTFDEALGYWAD